MTSLTQKKWIAFRVSVYLLGSFGLFVVAFLAWTLIYEFPNPSLEDLLGLGMLCIGGLLIISFQLLHMKLLKLCTFESLLTKPFLKWHTVLFVINFSIFGAVVTGLVYIIQNIINNWRSVYSDTQLIVFYCGWFLLTAIFLYNLIASLLFRKQLVLQTNNAHETMLNSLGKPDPE